MGLFDQIKEPIFLKESSEAEKQLKELRELLPRATDTSADRIEKDIRLLEAGIYGEKQIRFELENSHIPMIILHDLFLEYNGLTAQIDYLIVTRRHNFVVECKNLVGNIEINNAGDFIRTIQIGRKVQKEGIYSPITQNRRHLELIKAMRGQEKNLVARALFERNFDHNYRSIVVLANPKTVLNAKFAKKDVKSQVIRADQLASFIRAVDAEPNSPSLSEKEMVSLAEYFLSKNRDNPTDYIQKYRNMLPKGQEVEPTKPSDPVCPKCGAPMVRRKATKGQNAGKEFYGCSRFPQCKGIVNV